MQVFLSKISFRQGCSYLCVYMYKNVESNETRENVECKWERAYRAYFSRTPLHFMWLDVARVSMCVGARARTGQACLKG